MIEVVRLVWELYFSHISVQLFTMYPWNISRTLMDYAYTLNSNPILLLVELEPH